MKDSELQIFSDKECGQIRALTMNGEPWFLGTDITKTLDYRNGSRDIWRHVDEEDQQIISIFDGKQDRRMVIINESGLYSLIMGSRMEKAKRFKHWVTAEVLPSVRKNGGYVMNQENMTPE